MKMNKTKIALLLSTVIYSNAYAGDATIGNYTATNGVTGTPLTIHITDNGESGLDTDGKKYVNKGTKNEKIIATVGTIDANTDAWSNFKTNFGIKSNTDAGEVAGGVISAEIQMNEEVYFQGFGKYVITQQESSTGNADTRSDSTTIKTGLTDKAENSITSIVNAQITNGLSDKDNTSGLIANRTSNETLNFGATTDLKVTSDGEGTLVYGLSDATKNKLNTQSKFTVNGSTDVKTWALNDTATENTLNFNAGTNLNVSTESGSIKYSLNDQIALTDNGSITLGTTADNKIVIDNTGLDVNGTKINNNGIISGVADGVNDNDAVNVSQLNKIKPNTSKSVDTSIVIEEKPKTEGGKEYEFSLNEIVTIGKGNSPVGSNITIDGSTGIISGIADGVNDNDAVNVSQLKKVKANTTTTEDANIVINETDNEYGGRNYGLKLNNVVKVGAANPVTINGDNGSIQAGNITINNGGKITGVEDGEISATSKDAVNGSQLYALGKNVQNKIDAGVAQANAMAGLIQTTEKGKKLISASVGGYGSKAALAVGLSGMTDNGRIIYKVGIGAGHTGAKEGAKFRMGGNASIGYQW